MLKHPQSSLGAVGEFAVSALPWVTGSTSSTTTQKWEFPYVTKTIMVRNLGSSTDQLAIGFSAAGVSGSNRFVVPAGVSETFDVRCKEIFVCAVSGTPAYSLYAGLTVIDSAHMPTLTGSVWTGVG